MDRSKIILIAFLIAGLVNITSHIMALEILETYSKPFLMPILLFYVYQKSAGYVTNRTLLLAAALIFSWGGDLSLMYGDEYFILGVGSFLVAQILYILLFFKSAYQAPKFHLPSVLPFIVYGIVLFYFLLPNAGSLAIPVLIYGCSILTMASISYLRKGLTSATSFQFTFIGAILFLISDSLLGINKFAVEIPFDRIMVMSTYIVAQYLITEGMLRHAN